MIDILIVEDHTEIAELLTDFLRAENYVVSIAENGEKALSLFDRYGARLVLLDLMLPGIDGFAVCEHIRKTADTPILILSAKTQKRPSASSFMIPRFRLVSTRSISAHIAITPSGSSSINSRKSSVSSAPWPATQRSPGIYLFSSVRYKIKVHFVKFESFPC